MPRSPLLIPLLLLAAGCSAEVAGTAATAGAAREAEARQALETQQQVRQRLDQAGEAARRNLENADQAATQ